MSIAVQPKRERRDVLSELKFMIFPLLQLLAIALLFAGVEYVWIGPFVFTMLALFCDWIPDNSKVDELVDLDRWGVRILYTSAALQFLLVAGTLFILGQGEASLGLLISVAAALGVYNGAAGGNLSHEFMHRLNRFDLTVSRALSAMALHSTVTIDHLNTHHIEASRIRDPASGTRGQNFWGFALKSFIASNRNAAEAEAKRLSAKGKRVFSLQNRSIVGHLFEMSYLLAAFVFAGIPGLLAALAGGILSIILIEGFNYVAHYGLIRTDDGPYEARHAWSTRRVISSGFTFNITQHSQHHLHPGWHFWEIEAQSDMPVLPLGPSTLAAIAAIPPLWYRYMRPHLEQWDRKHASAEELLLRDKLK